MVSHLPPDAADQLEAALARLDRMSRASERMPRQTVISNQARGRERYERFVEALGYRLAEGQSLADEVSRDIGPADAPDSFGRQTG